MFSQSIAKKRNGYNKPVQPTDHPHIVKVEGVFGGRAIIDGTGLGVSTLVQDFKMGRSFDEILSDYPHINIGELLDALAYYYDHRGEIDEYLATNTEEYWRPIIERDLRERIKPEKSNSLVG